MLSWMIALQKCTGLDWQYDQDGMFSGYWSLVEQAWRVFSLPLIVFWRWQGIWTDSGHSQYPNLEMWKNVIDWSWFCSRNHYWDSCVKECSFLCSTILCIYTFSLSGICSQPMQTSIGMCEGCQRNMVPLACPKTAQSALLPTEPPVIIDQGCGYCCSSG